MVRFRQLLDQFRHRLQYVPMTGVVLAVALSQLMLRIDGSLDDDTLPDTLRTTIENSRSLLAAIAGGLISSVTLLLSMMLVAVQLASSQFSNRTLRNWIGDRTQKVSIGIVLGTAVYCLLVLREVRSFDDNKSVTPHLSVLVALILGIVSLTAVVRSVGHLTDRLRVGSIASGIMGQTIHMIHNDDRLALVENPGLTPANVPFVADAVDDPPDDAFAIVAPKAGWVQQIDIDRIVRAAPKGSTVYVSVAVGSYTFPSAPLAWVSPAPKDDDPCIEGIIASFAVGDERTMQQDIAFGILQMVDIALRAVSPGVNDPNTANDMIVHLGVIMFSLWERPIASNIVDDDGRRVITFDVRHADYLRAAFDPIRHYGSGDPQVATTMIRTLTALRAETIRRALPGPVEPIELVILQIMAAVDESDMLDMDRRAIHELATGVQRV